MFHKNQHMKYIFPLVFASLGLVCASCGDDEPAPEPVDKSEAQSGYVPVTILDYTPAPGQFVNEMPEWKSGMGIDQMRAAANSVINAGDLVSLGGWGGSIIYRLDKYITNKPGADFRVVGNAYYTTVIDGVQYGNCEPGVVFVMEDTNRNGEPDDVWYELWGSHTSEARSVAMLYEERNLGNNVFEILVTTPDQETIVWESNPEYHPHSYFPQWLADGPLLYTGAWLPANGIRLPNGQYTQESYTGYADAQPNNSEASALDISAAHDYLGNPVTLERVDFIKVQTGVLEFNGPIGECSTEVGRIQAL